MTDDAEPTASTTDHPIDALEDYATPLDGTDPDLAFDDLAGIGETLDDPRLVALGEATHGSREYFELKHRCIRYLVTEHDVRLVLLEANLPEALALNDYVVHGDGDPEAALEGVYFWTWQTEAVRATLEWLRAFNADRPLDDRVRFHGFDAQYTHGACRRLRDYLGAVDPAIRDAVADDLDVVDDEGTSLYQDERVEERIETADDLVPGLRSTFEENRGAYVDQAGESAWARAQRFVTVVEQAIDYKREAVAGGATSDDDPVDITDEWLAVRDRAMADNVDWLLAHTDSDSAVLWAHDAHVNREVRRVVGHEASAPSMGTLLADRHGDDYAAFGFAFDGGGFQAIGPSNDGEHELQGFERPGKPGTTGAALAALAGDADALALDVRSARDDDRLADWLHSPTDHATQGATYDPDDENEKFARYTPGEAFDALLYVADPSRARPLSD
jgi:erythromycin esterase